MIGYRKVGPLLTFSIPFVFTYERIKQLWVARLFGIIIAARSA